MKRLIGCSIDDDWGKCYEYIDGGRIGYTQNQLEELWEEFEIEELDYERAKIFTEDIPDQNNFYHNSIGYWEQADPPDREPDYII